MNQTMLPAVPAPDTSSDAEPGSFLRRGERALHVEGNLQASRQWYAAAYREAEGRCDGQAMGEAALGLGGLWLHEERTAAAAATATAYQRHALSQIDPQSSLALRLRVRLAGEADYRGSTCDAILAVLDEARLEADPWALAEALSLAHHCVLGPEHAELRRALAQDLIGAAPRTERRSDLLMGLLWLTVDLLLDADPHAERYLAQLRDLLAHQDHLAVGFVVSAIEVMLHIRAGRLAEAEELAMACAQLGVAAGDADATGWYGAQLGTIRWYQGRMAELVPMLCEMLHSPTLSAVDNCYFAALAVATATAGDQRRAAGELARLRGRDLAELPRSSSWLATMGVAVEAAYLLGDADTSAQAYALLSPYARLPMIGSLGVACFGSVQHALGVASLTMGDTDRAIEQFRAAVDGNTALGHWPATVASRARLGQALARRAGPGDAAAAQRELAAAAGEAVALGMALPAETGQAPAGPVEPMPKAEPAGPVLCRRQGRHWQLELGRRRALVQHSVGMLHLATLLANPGSEIPAAELAAGPGMLRLVDAGTATSAQPVLDETARREYRQRLSRLEAEIDDFQSRNEPAGAARSIAERDWLLAELATATGIGGRSRLFTDSGERARIAVGKAIRRALLRIAGADPVIGEELQATVRTGHRCSYWPR